MDRPMKHILEDKVFKWQGIALKVHILEKTPFGLIVRICPTHSYEGVMTPYDVILSVLSSLFATLAYVLEDFIVSYSWFW
jgi:hypothetical protein